MGSSNEQQLEASQANARPSAITIEQLMVRYQQADAAAATALIEQLSPQLYRFFAAQLGNSGDASDMLQDAWLRIHRVRHTYRAGEPLLPWVYAIARCVRVDSYRRRRRIAIAGNGRRYCSRHARQERGSIRPSAVRSADRRASRQPARSAHHAEGEWAQPGGGGARHFVQRRIGETKSASRVRALARSSSISRP